MTLTDLSVGTFVEVPGPPNIQRTGHQERIIGLKGWLIDREKNVFKVDRLVAGGSREGVNKRWDTENSNRFKLGIGGLETRDNLAEYVIKNSEPIPDYLQKDKLSHIFSSPFEVEIISDTNFTSNFIEGNIRTKNINGIKNITVYYGELDSLTLENKWSNKIDLPLSPNANEVPFKVSGLDFAKKYFLRVKVIGENGSSWSDSSRLVYTVLNQNYQI